jgi:ketosteroid isomerase-like protein
MLNREDALKTIDAAYAARASGDKAALATYWAEGAQFRIAADANFLKNVPLTAEEPMDAIGALIDKFAFSEMERVAAVVEGSKVAVHWAVTVRFAGGAPVRTELMDMIDLDDDGRIAAFVQFADTAQIRALMATEGEPAA